jgi:hypothetical protein
MNLINNLSIMTTTEEKKIIKINKKKILETKVNLLSH